MQPETLMVFCSTFGLDPPGVMTISSRCGKRRSVKRLQAPAIPLRGLRGVRCAQEIIQIATDSRRLLFGVEHVAPRANLVIEIGTWRHNTLQ